MAMRWYLEPRRGARHVQAGLTRREAKRRKLSTTKGEAKGRYKIVSYCPECPIHDMANPEGANKAAVTGRKGRVRVSCREGHVWMAGEGARHLAQPAKEQQHP